MTVNSKANPGMRSRHRIISRLTIMALTALVVVACSSNYTAVRPTSTGKTVKTTTMPPPAEDQLVIENVVEADPGIVDTEIYEGTGEFINEKAASAMPRPVADDGEIVLNFEGESIQSVVHTVLGEVLQETFVIAPGVGGEVTFSTSKPVTREQLLPILELLLRWNGAGLRSTGRAAEVHRARRNG
jgi:hypothetical protein